MNLSPNKLSSFKIWQQMAFFTKGHQRSIDAKKNIVASLLFKGLSMASNLIIVPLTINYINPSRYGVWLTLSSIIAWFSFFDIGFGNGLRNRFAEAKANGNIDKIRNYISTTYAILTIIFICVWLTFFIINFFLDWSKILNTPLEMANELSILALIIVTIFCFQIVLKTINTVIIADQKPALAALFDALGQIIALVIIFVLTKTTEGSLIYLGFVFSMPPFLILIIASYYLYSTKYKHLAPSIKFINFADGKDIFKLGSKFFFIQVAVIIIYQTNNIIITHVGSPEDVTIFNIAYKYLGIILMSFSIIISPYWTAFTEAYTKKDYSWMRTTVKELRMISYLLIIVVVVFIILSQYVYKLWIGDTVTIPISVTISVGFYIILLNITTLNTQILNGIGKIKIQLLTYSLATFFHIPLALYLGRKFGIVGVIISSSFFYIIISCFSIKQINLLVTDKAKAIWNK